MLPELGEAVLEANSETSQSALSSMRQRVTQVVGQD